MLGTPDAVEEAGSCYRYSRNAAANSRCGSRPRGGGHRSVAHAGARKASELPGIRGIGIGTTEDQILLRLGAPSRQSFQRQRQDHVLRRAWG